MLESEAMSSAFFIDFQKFPQKYFDKVNRAFNICCLSERKDPDYLKHLFIKTLRLDTNRVPIRTIAAGLGMTA